jgi:hypothetical protein
MKSPDSTHQPFGPPAPSPCGGSDSELTRKPRRLHDGANCSNLVQAIGVGPLAVTLVRTRRSVRQPWSQRLDHVHNLSLSASSNCFSTNNHLGRKAQNPEGGAWSARSPQRGRRPGSVSGYAVVGVLRAGMVVRSFSFWKQLQGLRPRTALLSSHLDHSRIRKILSVQRTMLRISG